MGGVPHVVRRPRYGGEPMVQANPILDSGERAWSYLTKQVKFGDAERHWDDLPVASIDYPELDEQLALPEMHRVAAEEAAAITDNFNTDLLAHYILAKS
jgi:hypothetical protein